MRKKAMEEMIERLRRERAMDTDSYKEGRTAGDWWANSKAREVQLKRLEELYARLGERKWKNWFDGDQPWRDIVKTIDPALAAPRQAIAFWEDIPGRQTVHDSDYYRGFSDGALLAWSRVKHEL